MTRVSPSDPAFAAIDELQYLLCAAMNPACFFDVEIPEPERLVYIEALLEHIEVALADVVPGAFAEWFDD